MTTITKVVETSIDIDLCDALAEVEEDDIPALIYNFLELYTGDAPALTVCLLKALVEFIEHEFCNGDIARHKIELKEIRKSIKSQLGYASAWTG